MALWVMRRLVGRNVERVRKEEGLTQERLAVWERFELSVRRAVGCLRQNPFPAIPIRRYGLSQASSSTDDNAAQTHDRLVC